jgi:RNA polymerase sigma-70 factor, ECF subfamily
MKQNQAHVPTIDPHLESLHDAFRREAPRLHRLALCYRGRADAAEDVVQETFVRALEALGRFRRDAELSTWLYRIAVNVCLDGLRVERGHAHRPLEAASKVRGCPGAIKGVEQRQIDERVRHAIDRLPPAQKMLVVLRDLEGLSYGDIVRVTRLSPGTVASRLNRARRRLARELAGLT